MCVILFLFKIFLCVLDLMILTNRNPTQTGFRRKKMAYWLIDSLEVDPPSDKSESAAQ